MRVLAWGSGWMRPPARRGGTLTRPQCLAVLLTVAAVLLLTMSWLADALLRPPLRRWAESKAVNLGTRAIAGAVQEHLLPLIEAEALFRPVTDAQGQLVMIDYNMARINQIGAAAAYHIQEALAQLSREELPIPLGQLTGLDFLAGTGPAVPVRIVPIGSVTVEPRSDFVSAGINVINHRLYVHVRVEMKVVAPYIDANFPVEQAIVLSNQVIPGRVPQVFVGIDGVDLRSLPGGRLALAAGQAL